MKYFVWTFLGIIFCFDSQSQDFLPFHIDTLWGYKNKQGVIKIEPQFQYASEFNYGIATVVKNDKLGAIDTTGKLVIPLRIFTAPRLL